MKAMAMKRATKTRVALLLLALAALSAPAAAGAAPHIRLKEMQLSVRVSGTHTVGWHLTEGAYPDPDRSWVEGAGTQTLSFRSPPVRYLATAVSGHLPGGITPSPLEVAPVSVASIAATLKRTGSWNPNDPIVCDREGGCDGLPPVVALHHAIDCPARAVRVTTQLESLWTHGHGSKKALTLGFAPATLDGLWPNCPPDMDGAKRPLYLDQPHPVAFGGAIKQIVHMAKGETIDLKATYRSGAVGGAETRGCPSLGGPGQQECAVTRVTVEVTRVH
jgi:hypothetical protein